MAVCGLLNLASCIPEKIFSYFAGIVSTPIKPLLFLVKSLLSEPINLSLFSGIWAIIVYIISMFYSLLLMYSGFNFMISGYDSEKRENAKAWLRNIIVMIILIQASFFIYQLIIELSSALTTATLSLADNSFFLLTFENLPGIAMQITFLSIYLLTLLLTSIILTIRYAFVSIGVVFFPLAIFLYFIHPLRAYGSLILNILGINIFVTFIDAIIIIGFSKLIDIEIFGDLKIFIMISAFLLIDLLMLVLLSFSIVKSALNAISFGAKAAALIAKVV